MTAMNNKKIFDNYLTNHYSNCEKTNFNSGKEVLSLLNKNKVPIDYNFKKFFKNKINKNSSILDLGCGYGSFLFFLQSHGYQTVTGVDISAEEIAICKKLFKSYTFHQADIHEYIHSTDKKFDVIYLSHVLEHIKKEDLFGFIDGIKNILTDDGFLVIVVPNSSAYFNAAANRYGDLTHEIGFTDISLRQMLMVAEFKNIEIKNFLGVGNLWINAARKIALFFFEIFIQLLGYDKQGIYTPSLIAIIKK